MDERSRSEIDSLKLKLALGLTLFMIVSMFVMNPPYNPNAKGAGGVFSVGQNVTMGNMSKSIQLTFLNTTTNVIELTFTTMNSSASRPIIDIQGFEPLGERIGINETITIGIRQWIVLSEIQPAVTGSATNEYFEANNTLQLTATGNGTVILFFPALGLVGTTLPLLFLLPVMALLPLGKHKLIIVIVVGLGILIVIATAG